MLFAVLASRSERLPTEHLGVMSLEAASLRDRACQGAPATRAKRGEYDPKYHCCRFLSTFFQSRGVRCHPQPLLTHQSGEHSGDIPSAVCQLPGHAVLGRGKALFKVAWAAEPLPAASSLRLQTQLVFLQPLCLLSAHGDAERDILQAQPEHAAAQRTGTSFGPERAGWSCRNKTGTA